MKESIESLFTFGPKTEPFYSSFETDKYKWSPLKQQQKTPKLKKLYIIQGVPSHHFSLK